MNGYKNHGYFHDITRYFEGGFNFMKKSKVHIEMSANQRFLFFLNQGIMQVSRFYLLEK
jgi:hypothetical protein